MTDTSSQQRERNQRIDYRFPVICMLCLVGFFLGLMLYDSVRAGSLVALWSWQDGVVLVLVLGWATWVEVRGTHPGTSLLVLLRILTHLFPPVFFGGVCLLLGACLAFFTGHSLILGLNWVLLSMLGMLAMSMGMCLFLSALWGWYCLPVLEFSATLPVWKRWMGWVIILLCLLSAVTAASLAWTHLSGSFWNGPTIIFPILSIPLRVPADHSDS